MLLSHQINCNGCLLDLSRPKIMGVLNITPDSFFDGGSWMKEEAYLKQAETMLSQGATILDVGGMSSKPGAVEISVKEELNRVLPVIERLLHEFPNTIISVDTYRSEVVQLASEIGIAMVNDISAGSFDNQLFKVVANLNLVYVLMHMQGQPKTMQNQIHYNNITVELLDFFIEKIALLRGSGVKDIILDVGFGFGKTLEHNYTLLANLEQFKLLSLPIMAGISRKSMIYKLLDTTPHAALNGTTAAHILALEQGACLLRVHDVGAAQEAIKIWEMYKKMQIEPTVEV